MQMTAYPSNYSSTTPTLLQQDENILRAIKVLDRTPVVDLHKIGVIYVGHNQSNEVDILANTFGSQSYTSFLHSLGRLIYLQESTSNGIYTGGLDVSPESIDGKIGIVWEDAFSSTQIIYHVSTLMPTDLERDPRCSLKKRHIGNDCVTIVFDESGLNNFSFASLPGQFNFINFVITPLHGFLNKSESTTSTLSESFLQQDSDKSSDNKWYHVEMRIREDLELPPLGILSEGKIISANELANVVRRAALHANMLALVVAQSGAGGGMFTSNARERLRQIKRIGERSMKMNSASTEINSNSIHNTNSGTISVATKNINVDSKSSSASLETLLDFTRYL